MAIRTLLAPTLGVCLEATLPSRCIHCLTPAPALAAPSTKTSTSTTATSTAATWQATQAGRASWSRITPAHRSTSAHADRLPALTYRSPYDLRIAIPEDVALPAAPQGIAGPTGRSYATDFLIALVVTLLVELPILWVLARGVFKLTAVSSRRLFAVGALGSLLTLPILWFVLPAWLAPGTAVILGEALAVAVEALLYWRLLPARPPIALALSFAVNLASFAVGLLVF